MDISVFSVGIVIAFYILLVVFLLTTDDHDVYGVLVIFAFAIVFILAAAIPIYYVIYSKIIFAERFKFLFALYNCAAITATYVVPFCLEEETYLYGGARITQINFIKRIEITSNIFI